MESAGTRRTAQCHLATSMTSGEQPDPGTHERIHEESLRTGDVEDGENSASEEALETRLHGGQSLPADITAAHAGKDDGGNGSRTDLIPG